MSSYLHSSGPSPPRLGQTLSQHTLPLQMSEKEGKPSESGTPNLKDLASIAPPPSQEELATSQKKRRAKETPKKPRKVSLKYLSPFCDTSFLLFLSSRKKCSKALRQTNGQVKYLSIDFFQ